MTKDVRLTLSFGEEIVSRATMPLVVGEKKHTTVKRAKAMFGMTGEGATTVARDPGVYRVWVKRLITKGDYRRYLLTIEGDINK